MKFKLRWASHRAADDDDKTIEINTLDDLKALQEREGHQLIVNFGAGTGHQIWIYDGYME